MLAQIQAINIETQFFGAVWEILGKLSLSDGKVSQVWVREVHNQQEASKVSPLTWRPNNQYKVYQTSTETNCQQASKHKYKLPVI